MVRGGQGGGRQQAAGAPPGPPRQPQQPIAPNWKDPATLAALEGLRAKGLLDDPNAWRDYVDANGDKLGWREKQLLGHLRGQRLLQPGNDLAIDEYIEGQLAKDDKGKWKNRPGAQDGGIEGGEEGGADGDPQTGRRYGHGEPEGYQGSEPWRGDALPPAFVGEDGLPTYPVAEFIAGMLGGGIAIGTIIGGLAEYLHMPPFFTRVNPDVSCYNLEKQILNDGAAGTAFVAGTGGGAAEVVAKPMGGGGGGASSAATAAGTAPSTGGATTPGARTPEDEAQIKDLQDRYARQGHDVKQAEQNIREINDRISRFTPEERAKWDDPNNAWGRDIRATLDANKQQIEDARAWQQSTKEALDRLGAGTEGGVSGYGPVHSGGIGRAADHDLTRQRTEDQYTKGWDKYEKWSEFAQNHTSFTPGGKSRAAEIIERANQNLTNPDGTFNQKTLDDMMNAIKSERRATEALTVGKHEAIGAAWDSTIAHTTLVRDVGMTIGLAGAGLAGAAIPGAFTAAGAGFNGAVGAVMGYSEHGDLSGTLWGAATGVGLGWLMEGGIAVFGAGGKALVGMAADKAPVIGKIADTVADVATRPLQLGTDAERRWLGGKLTQHVSEGAASKLGLPTPHSEAAGATGPVRSTRPTHAESEPPLWKQEPGPNDIQGGMPEPSAPRITRGDTKGPRVGIDTPKDKPWLAPPERRPVTGGRSTQEMGEQFGSATNPQTGRVNVDQLTDDQLKVMHKSLEGRDPKAAADIADRLRQRGVRVGDAPEVPTGTRPTQEMGEQFGPATNPQTGRVNVDQLTDDQLKVMHKSLEGRDPKAAADIADRLRRRGVRVGDAPEVPAGTRPPEEIDPLNVTHRG
ncbi:MAG TPA: hypothetical protein VEA16_12450, partial [Vicinamibacterales bacterium]|nr:hypothetical protein [Vicinamibacterales bacterium]